MKRLALLLLAISSLSAQTNIAIGNTTLQSNVRRPGINLGNILPYGPQQLYKNLTMYNPGMNDSTYASVLVCGTGSNATLCNIANGYANFPTGFWYSGNYVVAQSGTLAGCQNSVTTYTQPDLYVTGTWTHVVGGGSCTGSIAVGDYVWVRKTVTQGSSNYNPIWGYTPNTFGSPTVSTETSDLPTSTTGHTWTQALDVVCSGSGDYYYLEGFADQPPSAVITGNNFIDLNGTYTVSYQAKAVSGASPRVEVKVQRGGTVYLDTVDTITTSWAGYSHSMSLSETGPQSGDIQVTLIFYASQEVRYSGMTLSDVTTGGNPTVFRDAVVSALQALKPGVIRDWDGQTPTDTMANRLVDQYGRNPANYVVKNPANNTAGYNNGINASIPEVLQLCQTVGSDCWIVIPVTTSAAEATLLVDYLAGGSGTTGGALRIAQGYNGGATWTSVFSAAGNRILLEVGNETWNATFEGETYENNLGDYGIVSQGIFTAMRADSNYDSSTIQLIIGAQYGNPDTIQSVQDNCTNNDFVATAPYMNNNPTDATTPNEWNSFFAEPLVYWMAGASSGSTMVCAEYVGGGLCPSASYFKVSGTFQTVYGGGMYLAKMAAANSVNPKPLVVYEENSSTTGGSFTQTQSNSVTAGMGMGIELAVELLANMSNGVMEQNVFTLPQNNSGYTSSGGATYALLWGNVIDLGGPSNSRPRPNYTTEQMVNNVVTNGGTMLQTVQTGTATGGSTFSVGSPASYPAGGSTINTVAVTTVNKIWSYAFNNGSSMSLVLFNFDQTNSQAVTFSGVNAPSGTVTVTQLITTGGGGLGDINESTLNVTTSTSTLSSPSGMTLTPGSMYTLSWSGTPQPAVTFSPTSLTFPSTIVGNPSSPQTITLTNSGSATLTISSITITGTNSGDFGKTTTCGGTLSASASCNIVVTFTPSASGTRTASVSVADNAPGSPHTVPMTGTGAGAQTYYVSNSGSDSNNGTSPSTPWQTISKVNSTTRLPGDTVLFLAGGTWDEELNVTVAGTSGHLITYGSYGTGAMPIIDAQSTRNYCIYITTPSYVTVQGIWCQNAVDFGMYATDQHQLCVPVFLEQRVQEQCRNRDLRLQHWRDGHEHDNQRQLDILQRRQRHQAAVRFGRVVHGHNG